MRHSNILALLSLTAVLTVGSVVSAEVKLAGLFADNMVLQREQPVPVWGSAAAGEQISVSIAGQSQSAKAGKDGKWSLKLDALKAGGPHELVVKGENEVTVKNVLVGEVWLCSGQSNMAWTVAKSANVEQEIASAKHPNIRMFRVPRKSAAAPQADVAGQWQVCSPATVGGFSATGYFFGRKLHEELGVPIGLINSSVGGTPIEFWTSAAAQQAMFADPRVKAAGSTVTAPLKNAGNLYNGMIAPLAPFAIRGAIWYQGERNSKQGDPFLYRFQLPAMIANWRSDWGQGDFPFMWAQLPNFMAAQKEPVETNGWVLVREGMFQSLSTPNTGMATTIDVGEAGNIHPKNKQDVGKRLALWALAKTYDKEIVYSGPLFKSFQIDGDKIVIEFELAGSKLAARDDETLRGFAIAGKDQKFVHAKAKIVGQTVEVSSTDIPNPTAVRYAWASNPNCNLVNTDGLPAPPFRTDDWKN